MEHLTWFVGNRNPGITETIESAGDPVDLSSSTVQFRMRAVGSDVLKVDQPAVFVTDGTDGRVRYDWADADVDTAGQYLVWWTVTTSGKTQDVAEALIEVREHDNEHLYVELEQLKSTLSLQEGFADLDIRRAIRAASRGVDNECGRRFYPDEDALQVRYYDAIGGELVLLDDLIELTEVATDASGAGAFTDVWTLNTDFVLGPAAADGATVPFESLRLHPYGEHRFPTQFPRAVRVTGRFGWVTVPAEVEQATVILANRLLKRAREAPFAVAGMGFDGAAVRIAREDPDVRFLIGPYVKTGLGLA